MPPPHILSSSHISMAHLPTSYALSFILRPASVSFLDSSIDENFRRQRRPTHVPASMAGETDIVREAINLLLNFASPGAVQFHLSHFPLAQHLLPFQSRFPATTISFLGLLMKVAPFPLVEAQARAALHVFAHPHELDVAKETTDIVARYEQLRAELQTEDPLTLAKAWHVFKGLEQFDYRDELYAYTAPSFGGDAIVVPQWEKDMYDNKMTLTSAFSPCRLAENYAVIAMATECAAEIRS
ncbi:uncharacterized protein ARMOST_19323 [Armillaria ostoyae]|uniref:Uncharacterized protein n=1 Tax=Armillaria ostoyae TaxID=47428 RepID=A0A284S476_ARMOS|nr:uncharacterized protein ARMOST_19323 [Armillaria ostoyae]